MNATDVAVAQVRWSLDRWSDQDRLWSELGDRAADAIRGEAVVSAADIVDMRRDEFNNWHWREQWRWLLHLHGDDWTMRDRRRTIRRLIHFAH